LGYSFRIWQKDNPIVQTQFSLNLSSAKPSPTVNTPNPTTLPFEFDGSQWKLVSINEHQLIPGSQISLSFDNGTVQGNGGCNSYGGRYTTRSFNMINVYEVISTLIGCSEGIRQQEEAYFKSLHDAAFYRVSGGSLEFYDIIERHRSLVFQRN
jgi:heat shock protein HslJ